MAKTPRWTMHEKQYNAFSDPARFKTIMAGRRGGKSDFGIKWTFQRASDMALKGVRGVIWIVLPTSSELPTMWRKMQQEIPKSWITDTSGTEKSPNWAKIHDRVIVQFRSADAPGRLVAEGLLAVWIDECGLIAEEVWSEYVRPALMDHRAPALFTGTPKGKNWFYRLFVRGKNPDEERYNSHHWTSYANPFIDADEIDEIAEDMPERLYRQEILAEPLDDSASVFRNISSVVAPISNTTPVAFGIDLAKSEDFTVIWGLDRDGNTAYHDRFREVGWRLQKERIVSLAKKTGGTFHVDATGVGDPIVEDLRNAGVNCEPFKFTQQSKAQLIESLIIAIEERKITIPPEEFVVSEFEAFTYRVTRNGNIVYHAPDGLHDDNVDAAGLAWNALRKTKFDLLMDVI